MSILIAYDGSDDAKEAIAFAGRHLKPEPTVVLTVWEPLLTHLVRFGVGMGGAVLTGGEDTTAEAFAEASSREGAELARTAGLPDVEPRAAADTRAIWASIVETAEEIDASVIVSGSRGLSRVRSVLLGSVSNHILHQAERPVLVVPPAGTAAK